jgi:hypothetical protein
MPRARLSRLPLALAALLPGAADPGPPRAVLLGLTVHPASVELHGARARQRLGVLGEFADGRRWDLGRDAAFASSDEGVARVDAGGVVRPAGDGEATVTVRAGGRTAAVSVRVRGLAAPEPAGFRREVEPVLTRAGCNAGACHGSQHGKGGFRLSLFGFDPPFDYREIVQGAKGRRALPSDPERSLLLLKPTLQMGHAGGERFPAGSPSYEVLRGWLEVGAPPPAEGDPHVEDLLVWPRERLLVPGERQQLVVSARWSDGRVEDVTPLAKFDALNEAVAAVTPEGLVTAAGRGETHVMVRFEGQAKVVRLTLPYAAAPPGEAPAWNFIDRKLAARWAELGLAPSPLCGDEEFLRRLYLDVLGTLPAPAEVRAFVADTRADKRRRAIDAALDRPEFVDFWTLKWCDLLRVNRDLVTYKGMLAFHGWVRAAVRDNRPVDEVVRALLTAQGSNFDVGPANYYLTARGPEDMGEATAQLFLGVRMQCARCHHHPFEKWSQEDYCGLAAFFARIGTRAGEQSHPSSGRDTVVFLRNTGDVTHPRMDRYVKPHVLGGPDVEDPVDRRRPLAEWLTAPDNPFFARNLVNRFWSYLMGRGLVEPVDDLRATNPPSNPALLDALADDFVRARYDQKHLLRTILQARAYHLSSEPTPANRADAANAHFTRYTRRRLTAEQLADALDAATGTHESYPGMPPGTRAAQLPDPRVPSYLLDVFGRPARQAPCECERHSEPTIAQALHLLNGDLLNRKIDAPDGRVAKLLQGKTPVPELVEELYLAALGRRPRADEAARAARWVQEAPTPKEGAADLLWVLLNSREFLFNH